MKSSPFFLAASFALVLPSVAALGCDRPSSDGVARETRTTGATQPSVEQVKDQPAQFYGKRVTLSGEVDAPTADDRAFTLEGNDWLFDKGIRVLTRSPVKLAGSKLEDDQKVVVSGTVRRFTIAEIEREIGWDLTPQIEVELRDKPVLVADEVRRIEPSATWTEKEPEGVLVGTVMLVTATTPDALAGRKITVDDANVQSLSGKGMWIGPSHEAQTFVLPTGSADLSGIKAGDKVSVRGTVKKTPPADQAVKSWGLPANLRGVIEREPLFVEASEITRPKGK